jgi:hypothetical protein
MVVTAVEKSIHQPTVWLMWPEVQAAENLPMATDVGSKVTQIRSQWFSSGLGYNSPDAGELCGMICKTNKHYCWCENKWMMVHTG